jgi:hypothetical protein
MSLMRIETFGALDNSPPAKQAQLANRQNHYVKSISL